MVFIFIQYFIPMFIQRLGVKYHGSDFIKTDYF